MKMNSLPRRAVRRAFTLIELLVVIGILGVIGAIAADVFVNVSRSYNKASIIADVERNGNAALSQMVGEIRNARSVSSPDPATLDVVNAEGKSVAFAFVSPTMTDNGYVSRNGSPLTDSDFNSGVNVTALVFSVSAADPSTVAISITLSQPLGAGSRIDFQAGTTLQTTVSLRSY